MRFGLLASLLAFFLALGVAGTAFAGPGLGDSDSDGVDDFFDVCKDDPLSQLDTDGDGCGNACDGDFNQSGVTNSADFSLFRSGFLASASGITDMNGNGTTNSVDFSLFRAQITQGTPGPSLNTFRTSPGCP